jgi:hypothetical protein
MKANKKNYMPGGGMLRNQYQQGGALSYGAGYRMSAGQAASAAKPRQKFSYMPKPKEEQPAQASAMKQSVSTPPAQSSATAKTTPSASAPTVKPVSPVKGASLTSFGEAFAAARKQGAKEFEYKGKKYNTMLKSEGVKPAESTTQRSSETIRPMPSKVATEVGGKYFESPTGKMAYTPGKSTTANVAMAPMRTASSVASSASPPPQIRTTMSSQATPNATAKLREAIAEREKNKAGKAPMSPVAKAMMNRYMSKYGSK